MGCWARREIAIALTVFCMIPQWSKGGDLSYRAIPGVAPKLLPVVPIAVRADVEGFVDGVMESLLASKPAAGAVVAIVKDGRVLLAKGYGYRDVAQRVPVDADRTLFRPASIGKLFTWTAVMQLVEEGKLNLDADVNTYLKDFQLPPTFSQPVTLRNLMTHTGGFEDGFLGYHYAESERGYVPLELHLRSHMPNRVLPPTVDFSDGRGAAYSNWGAALAGLIVANVSGMPYEEYIERRVFSPLRMTNSTVREPLPERMAAELSNGYLFVGGAFQPQRLERAHNMSPAGSSSLTATDMARFMLAYLQDGELDGMRLLKPTTIATMHTRSLSPHPALNGMALGFWDFHVNGRRVLWHGGDTAIFHSVVSLVPQERLGLFVAFNTGGPASSAAREFERRFLKHYFPAELATIAPRPDSAERNRAYVGTYRTLRRSYTKVDKLLSATSELRVAATSDGALLFPDFMASGRLARWLEVGDGVFRNADDDVFVAFVRDPSGRVTHLLGPLPTIPFARLQWYDSTRLHTAVIASSALLFVWIVLRATVTRLRNPRNSQLHWAHPVLAIAGTLLIACVLTLYRVFSGDVEGLYVQIPRTLYVALTLPLLAIPLLVVALVYAALAWRRSAWSVLDRLAYSVALMGSSGFLGVLSYWNLIGYRFG